MLKPTPILALLLLGVTSAHPSRAEARVVGNLRVAHAEWATQGVPTTRIDSLSKDSVMERYVYHGAFRFGRDSRERVMYLDSALMFLPHEAYLWQQKAMPLYKQMKYEAGEAFLDSAVKYDTTQNLDYRAFMECIFSKRYRESLADFQLAKRMRPDAGVMDHEYNWYMGLCYLQLDKFDSAEQCFAACVKHDERLGKDWVHYMHTFYLGIVMYEEHRYADAIENFDRAIARYPHFSDAKYYKSLCIMKLHDTKAALPTMIEARDDFREGYTVNEDNAIYERYPYQLQADWAEMDVKAWEKEAAKAP